MEITITLGEMTVKMLTTMANARHQTLQRWIEVVLATSARQMAHIIGTQDAQQLSGTLNTLRSVDALADMEKALEPKPENNEGGGL